jgi:hypothetical protein
MLDVVVFGISGVVVRVLPAIERGGVAEPSLEKLRGRFPV